MSRIDASKVPAELRNVISLAEKWGASSEEAQIMELAEQASDEELLGFLSVFDKLDIDILNEWLNLPELCVADYERVAFMLLTMAVSVIEQEIENRNLSTNGNYN